MYLVLLGVVVAVKRKERNAIRRIFLKKKSYARGHGLFLGLLILEA